MAEIDTPRDPWKPPPSQGGGADATGGALAVTALGGCCGVCFLIFGAVFASFLLFPYGIGLGIGLLGVLGIVAGIYLLYWTCRYAQDHSRVY